MLKKIKFLIRESPSIQTLIFFFSVIVSGVLSGTLVTEITINSKIDWKLIYKSTSFYFILLLLFLVYIYNKFLHEGKINEYKDKEFCRAYLRREALPELAKKNSELIKKGQNPQDLKDIDSLIEDLFK
ncbi:hypothetical protein PN499_04595 [Kamptonema animale CS-326]|jgi:hypothetical protein|uniref:hypothetical protein n=1 Tax=Kamptonema animale TaxID=92934 RepID=UPI00232C617C|nr:hypothetical protein [Kamptonema animale]MDB9510459.1 hypothetical protein [Kamptonema animale CS-326]